MLFSEQFSPLLSLDSEAGEARKEITATDAMFQDASIHILSFRCAWTTAMIS